MLFDLLIMCTISNPSPLFCVVVPTLTGHDDDEMVGCFLCVAGGPSVSRRGDRWPEEDLHVLFFQQPTSCLMCSCKTWLKLDINACVYVKILTHNLPILTVVLCWEAS